MYANNSFRNVPVNKIIFLILPRLLSWLRLRKQDGSKCHLYWCQRWSVCIRITTSVQSHFALKWVTDWFTKFRSSLTVYVATNCFLSRQILNNRELKFKQALYCATGTIWWQYGRPKTQHGGSRFFRTGLTCVNSLHLLIYQKLVAIYAANIRLQENKYGKI
jgi:hypothetical protein